MAENWKCPSCGGIVPGKLAVCPGCRTSRPAMASANSIPFPPRPSQPVTTPANGNWRCLHCGGINPAKQTVCLGCRKPKGATVPVEKLQYPPRPVSEKWKCPKCGNINPDLHMVCLGCNTPRQDLVLAQSTAPKPPEVKGDKGPDPQTLPGLNSPVGAGTNPAGAGIPSCPQCQEPIKDGWHFCRWCGAALQATAPAAVQASRCMNDIFLSAIVVGAQVQKTQAEQASHYQPSEYAMSCALNAGVASTIFPS